MLIFNFSSFSFFLLYITFPFDLALFLPNHLAFFFLLFFLFQVLSSLILLVEDPQFEYQVHEADFH